MSDKCGPVTEAAKTAGHGIKVAAVATGNAACAAGNAIAATRVAQAVKEGAVKTGQAISETAHDAVNKVSEY